MGKTCFIGDVQFLVLGQANGETAVITKDIVKKMPFGENNNFDGSNVDAFCKEFAAKLADKIGEENILEHVVDLTADDGLRDYGSVTRKASLLTAKNYRGLVGVLDKHRPNSWWWLATPFSTPSHNDETCVKCVSPAGCVNYDYYFIDYGGVRPFCILKSSIFVSLGA